MDDFSFPTVQTGHDSPAHDQVLWFYRRSFSSAEETSKVADSLNRLALSDDEGARDRFAESEEKMDMLWEEFNEELHRVSCEWNRDMKKGRMVARASDVEFGVSRRGRPGLVAMLKVLKKLFLVQRRSSARRVPPIYKI